MNEITVGTTDLQNPAPLVVLFEMQLREQGIQSSPDLLRAALAVLRAEPAHGFVLSATCDSVTVGVAYAARILSLEHGGWSGWLEEIYVLPEWRGRGVGSRLLAAIINGATERGWAALELEVDLNHERVIPLYTRHAFAPVNRTRFVRRLQLPGSTPTG